MEWLVRTCSKSIADSSDSEHGQRQRYQYLDLDTSDDFFKSLWVFACSSSFEFRSNVVL